MKHLIIPDTQVKPGTDMSHLRWAGKFAADKRPDVIIHLGDHYDMPSLSSYDKGKRSFEGRRYKADIEAGNRAMDIFMEPINRMNGQLRRAGKEEYKPRLVFLLGNHEHRIERTTQEHPELEGILGYHDFNLEQHGWEVHPFNEVVIIDGIAYTHYHTSGVMGRPVTSARIMLNKKMMSCVMGHVQQRDVAFAHRADGKRMIGLFAGTYYQHDEDYLGPQGNNQWRGLWMLHEVDDGGCDEMPVSINYLEKKYGGE